MILSFKPQFVQPINDGTKIHTLREDPADRWKPGMIIHFATGVRTPQYNNWKMGECISTQRVTFEWVKDPEEPLLRNLIIRINARPLSLQEAELFAKNDGFNYLAEFVEWFGLKGMTTIKCLKLIHWTQHRY